MSTIRNEMQLRLHKRIEAEDAIKKLKPPHLLSTDAKKNFDTIYKEQREAYLEACLMETRDMQILLAAMNQIESFGINVDSWIDLAWSEKRMDESLEDAIAAIDKKAAEEREKAAKSDKRQGDLEGQQKLGIKDGKLKVKDDGSEAEPASECTSEKVDPEQLDEELAKRDAASFAEGGPLPEPMALVGERAPAAILFDIPATVENTLSPELKEQVKELELFDALVVLRHHFENIGLYTPETIQQLVDHAAEAYVVKKPAPETPLDGVISSGEKVTETFKKLGKEIAKLGEQKAALEAPLENWDEPQRKEPEPEPEVNPLKAAAEKKRAAKASAKKATKKV